ncbi:AI-2E family transporter [Brachybacterium sp. J153]|uniref:AI-2E family transporter n=1 Tax=Brachybacterium sp. J153 TaxID=3116488 RepID=UPI002E775204|nr:AI-2E family transporter [Brachybacterium sp. J153]MEE1617228.1 AI-2E family transporter [Brachybacterium sp. J153]
MSSPVPARGPGFPRGSGLPRGLVLLLSLAAIWLVLAGMRELAGLVVPVFLALNLMIAAQPLSDLIQRAGAPRLVGSLAAMLAVLLALGVFFLAIGWSIRTLVLELPGYSASFNDLLQRSLEALAEVGVSQEQISAWLAQFSFASLFGLLNQALSSVSAVGGLVAASVATIIFFGLDATGLPERMAVIERLQPRIAHALADFALSVRTYWLVTTVFGAVVAVIDGLALWALGVPLPAVWAVLLFVCNYIPNIGFVIAMVPPTLMALLDQGPWTAVAVVAVCVVVAMVLQGLVQPRVTGRAVGLAPSISFLSVLFWSWVLGAAGALLSVPMTLLVKEILVDADDEARWLNALVADSPRAALESPQERVGGDARPGGASAAEEAPAPGGEPPSATAAPPAAGE